YVIKILARDSTTGRIGTYQAAFTVPNLMREELRLPISSVVLSSQRVPMAEALHTVQNGAAQFTHPLVYDGEKLFPSVTRVFSRTREMYVYLQPTSAVQRPRNRSSRSSPSSRATTRS